MTLKALGETARFINGAAFKPADWEDGGLPIIRIQNLTGTGEKFNFTSRQVKPELVVEPGDLLVSWSATLDVYRWTGPRGVLNQHIFKVLPNPGIDPDYLFYALKSALAELSAKTHGSTMKHVVCGDFESTQVRMPPLAEQHRIVDILSRAEGIVRLRREAEKKAAELISPPCSSTCSAIPQRIRRGGLHYLSLNCALSRLAERHLARMLLTTKVKFLG